MLWRTLQLLKSKNSETRMRAIRELGNMGGLQAVHALMTLQDYDYYAQQAASAALAQIGLPAVESLMEGIKSENAITRDISIAALKVIKDARTTSKLIMMVKDKDVSIRNGARSILCEIDWQPENDQQRVLWVVTHPEDAVRLGSAMIESLVEALNDKDAEPKITAVKVLGKVSDVRAVEPLIHALMDVDGDVQRAAAEALSQYQDTRAVEPLVATLSHWNRFVRLAGIKALANYNDVRAVAPLLALLKDNDGDIRNAALNTLMVYRDVRFVEPLVASLHNRNSEVRLVIARLLGKIADESAVNPLMMLLKDENDQVEDAARESLGSFDWQPQDHDQRALRTYLDKTTAIRKECTAIYPLVSALEGNDEQAQLAAVAALGRVEIPMVLEPLVKALDCCFAKSRYSWEKGIARAFYQVGMVSTAPLVMCLILGSHRLDHIHTLLHKIDPNWPKSKVAKEAIPLFVSALQDRFTPKRWEIANEMGYIGDLAFVEPLSEALSDEDWRVREAAADSLGEIAEPRAVVMLIAALNDHHLRVRQAVACALAQIGSSYAVRPLVDLIGLSCADEDIFTRIDRAKHVAEQLQHILELSVARLTLDDLRAVAGLSDWKHTWTDSVMHECWPIEEKHEDGVYCESQRQLARAELARRGLSIE